MNERIRQLVLQAKIGTADFDARSYYVATPDRMQKFAELIIEECVDYAFANGDNVDYLKQYFGVE